MKNSVLIFLVLLSSLQLRAQFEDLTFGTDSTLEIVTWNIENFPKEGNATIDYVAQIITALDIDVVAIQEVTGSNFLNQLIDKLDGWEGFYAYNKYAALCYVYKTDVLDDIDIYEIYTSNWLEFPRSPLVMEMDYEDKHYVIINNHLKCCGDGILDLGDDDDEEKRRFDACNLLDAYIEENHPGDRVVLLGDLNDVLTDSPENNVFKAFIDKPNRYLIADMDIAKGGSTNWSYPTWPSHIDHIFISNEIVNDYLNYGSDIRTIKLDKYFNGGWSGYEDNVSDHRPVGLKIKTDNNLGVSEFNLQKLGLSNYPNPFSVKTSIAFSPAKKNSELIISTLTEQKVGHIEIIENQTSIVWNTKSLPSGIYLAKLIVDGKLVAIRKMVLLK